MYASVSVARMSKDDSPCWGDGEACLDDHTANGSLHRASVLSTWESGRVQKLGSVQMPFSFSHGPRYKEKGRTYCFFHIKA